MPMLKGVIRMDSLPVARTYFTEEGYLVDRPILTSIGIFEYRNEDGSIRRELRLPDEVFDRESLESYRLKPIIITHDAGLVTKDNVQDYQVGTIVSNGYRSGDDVRAEIVIHDTNAMKKAGLKELSLGYNLDLDETPGVWEGQPYDAIQRNIRINHLALVREARAGDQARLNIDSRDRQTLKGGKATMRAKKTRKTSHNDSVLSPEELSKAIEEYKARRSGEATDAVEVPATPTAPAAPAPAPAAPAAAPKAPQIPAAADRNRDADEDMKLLFDIIDTLLADKAFDAAMAEQKTAMDAADEEAAGEEETEEVTTDADDVPPEFLANQKKGKKAKKAAKPAPAPVEEVVTDEDDDDTDDDDEDTDIVTDADDDDTDDEEDTDIVTDADDEEETEDVELTEDEDDLEAEDEDDEELTEDEDDTEEEEPLAEDDASSIAYANADPVPEANRKPAVINTDAIDAIVRQRVAVLRVADKLNLDGVDELPLKEAKKAIIKEVTPNLRLDGKSNVYIDALYDRAVAEVNARSRKDTQYQVRQMYNKKSRNRSTRADADDTSAEARRQAMLERRMNKEER